MAPFHAHSLFSFLNKRGVSGWREVNFLWERKPSTYNSLFYTCSYVFWQLGRAGTYLSWPLLAPVCSQSVQHWRLNISDRVKEAVALSGFTICILIKAGAQHYWCYHPSCRLWIITIWKSCGLLDMWHPRCVLKFGMMWISNVHFQMFLPMRFLV